MDGRITSLVQDPLPSWGAFPGLSHLACGRLFGLTFTPGHNGKKTKSVERWLAKCSGISFPHSTALPAASQRERKYFQEVMSGSGVGVELERGEGGIQLLKKMPHTFYPLGSSFNDNQTTQEMGRVVALAKFYSWAFSWPHLVNQGHTAGKGQR